MNVHDRIKKAHVAIMRHKTFCAFAGIVACGDVEITTDIPTACTDGWNRKYNPDFVTEHLADDAMLRFVVLHEATHVAYSHLRVWRSLADENPRLANIAMDHFVNLSLQDTDAGEGFIRMPAEGIQPEAKYRGWSVKQIYDDLKQQKDEQQGKGGGGGDNPDDPDEGSGFDQHDWKNASGMSPAQQDAIAEEVQRALRQGEIVRRKRAGSGSGGADAPFGDLLAPKIDWRKVLREFITETCAGRDESTWRKPNRRYLADDIYMPSMTGTTMTELVVGFDTSGSIFGGIEMTQFVSELATIVGDIKPQKCRVVYWDSEVVGEQMFEEGQFAVQNLKPRGGGGTDGSVLFDYMRAKRIQPQAVVNFTDGYVGNWGQSDVPTLWAVTSSARSPWGTTIKLEV